LLFYLFGHSDKIRGDIYTNNVYSSAGKKSGEKALTATGIQCSLVVDLPHNLQQGRNYQIQIGRKAPFAREWKRVVYCIAYSL